VIVALIAMTELARFAAHAQMCNILFDDDSHY